MKQKILHIVTILFLTIILTACVEREYFDDTGIGPPVSGLFKEIEGSISGILTYNDSPYYVKNDLTVDSSASLIIEPGVELYFETGKSLIVKGKLNSTGERFSRIYFLPYRNTWAGINIDIADSETEFQFCVFENMVSSEIHFTGSVMINESDVNFKNCYFRNNSAYSGGAISSLFSTVDIRNVIFNTNSATENGGAISAKYSDVIMINNVFNENKANDRGGAVAIEFPFRTEFQNNIFFRNEVNENLSHIAYLSGDTTNYIEQYNYIATGNMDPYFISENNFRLIFASPCKNAGNPAPQYNNFDGTRNDQGAYGGPFGNW